MNIMCMPLALGLLAFTALSQAQYFDSETGLHYNNARYYDPRNGRYISSDPIGLDGGMNTYVYVDNNPLRWSDPTGLTKWTGSTSAGSFVPGIGAGGMVIEVRSECINGKRGYVKALAVGPGIGVGVKLPKLPKELPSGTRGDVEFDDYVLSRVIDPNQFEGRFKTSGISAVVGVGAGHSIIQCGHAFARETGISYGFDVGATAIIGSCTVLESRIEDCECKK